MLRYVVKRLLLALVTVLVISSATFFLMNAVPGGPFAKEKAPSKEVQLVLEERFHLNEPIIKRFGYYINNFIHGDLGVSLKSGREVKEIIGSGFKVSFRLGIVAGVLSVLVGVSLGMIAALNRNRWPDRAIIFLTTLFVSVPSFILASFLLLLFGIVLRWVPIYNPDHQSFVLPTISLMLYPMSYITRLTKTSMLDVLGQDYIRTARAKGVSNFKIISKHALKNGMLPVITYCGPMFAYIITGSLVVESIFAMGGLGTVFIQAINNRDYSVIMGTTIFLAIIMIVLTLVSDLMYKFFDPRIQFE